MPRIQPVNTDQAQGQAAELLAQVQKKMGRVPNILGTMAQAPSVLAFYLQTGETLGRGNLSGALREQIALTVSGVNRCHYCGSAHGAIAQMHGVSKDEAVANLAGRATDDKVQAALTFAEAVVEKQGFGTDDELAAFKNAGYSDGDAVEVIAEVAKTVFTNYFNHVAETEVDFPDLQPAAASA